MIDRLSIVLPEALCSADPQMHQRDSLRAVGLPRGCETEQVRGVLCFDALAQVEEALHGRRHLPDEVVHAQLVHVLETDRRRERQMFAPHIDNQLRYLELQEDWRDEKYAEVETEQT